MKIRILSVIFALLIAISAAAFVSCRSDKADGNETESDSGSASSSQSEASSEDESESTTIRPSATVTEPIVYTGLSGKAHVKVDSVNSIFVCTFDESNLEYDIGCEMIIHLLTDDGATYRFTTVSLGGYEEQIIDGPNCIGVVFKLDRQWNFEEFPVEITVTFASYRFNFVYAG